MPGPTRLSCWPSATARRCGPRRASRPALAVVTLAGRRVALAVPTTYMNDSGVAVRQLATRFGIDEPASVVIVHDELDLPPGTVRLKEGGGLAGHNGLRSVQSHLHSSDFLRVRIGVGKPPERGPGRVARAEAATQGGARAHGGVRADGGGRRRAHCGGRDGCRHAVVPFAADLTDERRSPRHT